MSRPADLPWRSSSGCVIVRVRLTPKSSLEAVEGVGATTKARRFWRACGRRLPMAKPTRRCERLVARWLDVPKSAVRLTHGAKSRVKSLTISGDLGCLEQRLRAKLAAAG